MRLVRIDGLTPGGRGLDLHPRLSVLVGAPPEARALLGSVFTALVDGTVPPTGGQLEVHGIRMDLDRVTLELLDVRAPVDPFLDLDAPDVLRPGSRGTRGPDVSVTPVTPVTPVAPQAPAAAPPVPVADPTPDPADPARGAKEIAERDLLDLRLELRSVGGELTVLARRMDETRTDLDSFARATLNVALEQVDAVESRLAGASAERNDWEIAVRERRAALVVRLEELRADHARLKSVDPSAVRVAGERLAQLLDPPTEPDPAALELAARLDDLVRSAEELESRRLAAEGLLAESERRLADALAEADEAQDSYRSPSADPTAVLRLERVRDEIYELEERGGRLAAVRSKRRIDELRAEEAELLDRLGFDTYSSYVMGIPTARAEAERALRLDAARAKVETMREAVERLRADAPGGAEDQWNDAERSRIIDEAAALLATPAVSLGRLTTVELHELLSSRVLPPPPETSAEILSAAGRLASTMTASGAPAPTTAVGPRAMLVMASDWLGQMEDRDQLLTQLRDRIDEADQELAALDEDARRADDGGRTADLEAELLVVRQRVAEGEARVARHQAAMSELADLRTLELELRDRERDLLARIADRERLLTVLGADIPPPPAPPPVPPAVVAPPSTESLPVAGTPLGPTDAGTASATDDLGRDVDVVWPVNREWRLLSRLGDVRSVAHVGSVPLLVAGINAGSPDTAALLHRMHGMSELVQMLVLTDDERVARWAEGLGPDAGVTHW